MKYKYEQNLKYMHKSKNNKNKSLCLKCLDNCLDNVPSKKI